MDALFRQMKFPGSSAGKFSACLRDLPCLQRTWLPVWRLLLRNNWRNSGAIYDGAPVGLGFLDKNLRFLSQNKRLSQLSAAPFGPRLGRTMEEAAPVIFLQLEPHLSVHWPAKRYQTLKSSQKDLAHPLRSTPS